MNKVYLIYGNEKYFIDEQVNKIVSEYKEYDLINYDMCETNINKAVEEVSMISLFSTDKIVICYNALFLTGIKCDIDHDIDSLLKFIVNPSTSILVLVVNSDSLDKRKKVVKELQKYAEVKECDKLKENELLSFIKKRCVDNGYEINNDALNKFVLLLNDNLYVINSELDKLFIYKEDDKVISISDIDICTSRMLNDNIFDLVDAIVKKDINRSLALYDDLIILNEEEIKLIVILANQFRLIFQVKEMFKTGYNEFDIAKKLDIHPYRVKLANNVGIDGMQALKYLKESSKLDADIKTGVLDKRVGFLEFILNLTI